MTAPSPFVGMDQNECMSAGVGYNYAFANVSGRA